MLEPLRKIKASTMEERDFSKQPARFFQGFKAFVVCFQGKGLVGIERVQGAVHVLHQREVRASELFFLTLPPLEHAHLITVRVCVYTLILS